LQGANITVVAGLGNDVADVGQFLPTLKAFKTDTGHTPKQTPADAG